MIRRRWGSLFTAVGLACAMLPSCTSSASVADVWLSNDDDGARRKTTFFADATNVTCIAQIGVGRNDATFGMLIRRVAEAPANTSDYRPVNKVIIVGEHRPTPTTGGPTTITLSMKPTSVGSDGKLKEDSSAPYTTGSYVCEVSIDGVVERRAAFNIDYAPCPAAQIQPTTPCLGFYKSATQCPAAGASGDPTPKCSCTDRGWQCDPK